MENNITLYIVAGIGIALFIASKLLRGKASSKVVAEKIANGATVIDVRTRGEYETGAWPGAKNIPVDTLSGKMAKLPKNGGIVVYCASGARAAQAVRMLKSAGFTDVVNAGGLSDMPRR